MKEVLVECVDCNWQGNESELEDTADDLEGAHYCPRCGGADIQEIEENVYPDEKEDIVMMCQICGLMPTEEELESGICVECGSTQFVEDN